MERARVFVSLPFRAEGLEAEYPGCLRSFDARQIDRFLAALQKEILAVSGESSDLLVQEIVLGNGSASHLTADDLAKLLQSLRMHFRVSPKAIIRITMTPSGFDFYKLNAVRQMGKASICFEFPALTEERLRAGGYHCSPEKAAAALECCFQNGFRSFSVFLTAGSLEEAEAEQTLKTVLASHPEEIILRRDAEDALVRITDRILTQEGWTRADNRWYSGAVPAPTQCAVQIGCGPGAVSVFDQTALRSTADFDFYCEYSDDFEALVRHAEAENTAGI